MIQVLLCSMGSKRAHARFHHKLPEDTAHNLDQQIAIQHDEYLTSLGQNLKKIWFPKASGTGFRVQTAKQGGLSGLQ